MYFTELESIMDDVVKEFNTAIDDILVLDSVAHTLHGKVCLVCDKFVSRKELSLLKLKTFLQFTPYFMGDSKLPADLRSCYQCTFPPNVMNGTPLQRCLLSPCSKLVYKSNQRGSRTFKCHQPFVICCADCKSGLSLKKLNNGELPRYAIANNLAIGSAPECLLRLNDVELALLSQARFRGHLFTYWGGCHKSIKGWHSFYDVDPAYTTAVLQQVSSLTNSDNIAVVLSGPFTSLQKNRVLEKVHVNIPNVEEAFNWLKANNNFYAQLPIPTFTSPTIIDNSKEVEDGNTDIELKEEIRVVFPDGTIHTGGCADQEAFEKVIADLRTQCGDTIPNLIF